ncbi:hypothetical protein A2U01_0078776, partial [Trifolium medium]|nr:hypothetical protein [Trifolium medium]
RGIPSSCTRSVGTIFPRKCLRTSAPQRIGRSASLACRGGFARRGGGAPFPCTILRSRTWATECLLPI